jgi:DNA repair protein RecO (recombination protein O)
MALVHDRCFCLRKVEYSETSQILTLLGRDRGLFRVIAKGAHRRTKAGASRFDGGADLLDIGDAQMTDPSERELATLTEWKLVEGHLTLRSHLRSVHLALYAAELVGLLQENDPHPEIFDLLIWLLTELAGDRREEVFVSFQLALLRELGYLPSLIACESCGRELASETRSWLVPHEGRMLCDHCPSPRNQRLMVDARVLRMLQTLLRLPVAKGIPQRLPRLTRLQSDPVNTLLAAYLQQALGRRLRVAAYILPPGPQ